MPKSKLEELNLTEANFRSRPKHRLIVAGSLAGLTLIAFRENIMGGVPFTGACFGTVVATVVLSYIFAGRAASNSLPP